MGLIVLSTMQCPTSINLTQLAQGTLDDISVANIERHLLTSETCRQSLAQIEIALDDPLSQRLKNADALFRAKSSRHQKFSVVIPGFRIIKQLGSGGMGTVYEAVDEKSGEIRAIKVLHSERQFDKNIVARFLREKEIAVRLKHPNIVKPFLYNNSKHEPLCIVMERLRGMDVSEHVKKHGLLLVET